MDRKKILVVDLDDSLLKIDLFKDALGILLLKQPRVFLKAVLFALRSKANAKTLISKEHKIKLSTLPYNNNVIKIITDYRDKGYKICLATGAARSYAIQIANHLGLFEKVIATDNKTNNVGRNKLNAIKDEVGDNFIYLGDSKKDVPIWLHCKKAIMVGKDLSIKKKLEMNNVEIIDFLKKEKSIFQVFLKQIRLHQWSKNLLLFIPGLASHQLIIPSIFFNSLKGFIAFSLLASSVYVLNDIVDVDYDRKHPKKKNRPIAAGDISIFSAYAVMLLCLISGVLLAINLGITFLFVGSFYIILNILYSFYLKKFIILDVIILMSFYTLRLLAGHIPDAIPLSPWLSSFSIFLFFSLGLLKRYVDTIIMKENDLSKLEGRGYSINDGNALMTLGAGSGMISALILILYVGSEQVQQFYATPMVLLAMAPVMLYWISRMWLLAERGVIESDPVFFAIKDKVSYGVVIMLLIIMFLSKYIQI